MTGENSSLEVVRFREAERLSHALYGLIIVTAALGAEMAHITEASEALVLLLSTAMVLMLAHTYSAAVAERAIEGHSLGSVGRRMVVADNIPVLSAVVVPVILFALAGADVMTLQTSYTIAIVFSLATLFGVGLYEGRRASMGWIHSILSGAAAGAIGVIVVVIEAFFD
jgi:hypothetical protein